VEDPQQALEVAGLRGAQERGDDAPLGVGVAPPVAVAPLPHTPSGPAGELAGRLGRALQDRADLLERDGEHVVQHERHPLGGRQRVEDDEQRAPDRVGDGRLVGRARASRHGVVRLLDGVLPPRSAGAQPVEADAGDDRRQPAAEVVDAVRVAAGEPQPGVLHGVVGLALRAEHPVGHRPQPGAALLEPDRQRLLFHDLLTEQSGRT
jgi:hypothetical protein